MDLTYNSLQLPEAAYWSTKPLMALQSMITIDVCGNNRVHWEQYNNPYNREALSMIQDHNP